CPDPRCASARSSSTTGGSCSCDGPADPGRGSGLSPADGSRPARRWPKPSCASCGRRRGSPASAVRCSTGWSSSTTTTTSSSSTSPSPRSGRWRRWPVTTRPRRRGSRCTRWCRFRSWAGWPSSSTSTASS
ncbi:MAG: NUDIX hydrolase, partial [uncultured Acidimicrobiales bacterium]